ncbi:glyoxylase-like metal-dependent hydrolase (beta-lactamase superfamily II)/rhodanese-related sulfurtransferase [Kribbella aluminosa]|uniref:Glyoxylase-like metal-dependent hydrolase (Beta-lactamase superfamily II)/rhodanese-related sulfurtransferase n=1 Tax=Kribbella aluminosa TaxID=416017 RepID=A0ABS4V154_9ACTN|nr:MBL fold metallo-hydrolase [Kribbella aluminosa]MBP2357591.1 glyoxylase-like metal-dependent hydrolase (beta-lactamase superfamily II)/rhodanese-related sulfurtransferase [Kribbella aluminosa]
MNDELSKMIAAVVDEGLGNSSYLVDLGDGRALAVDPSLDLRALRMEAERRNLTVAFAADTHLHADFLSGAVQLAAVDGARLLASAAGGREYAHEGLADGDEIDLGGLTLRTLATPGHTGEHLSFELLDGPAQLGVFTGGSLIVGGAARTDLAGTDQTEQLTRLQYRSLQRLAALPDATAVLPTHGAGSFCSAPQGGERVSTIGQEKRANPLLQVRDEDEFVGRLLAGLGTFPPYFLQLPEANRRGPALIEEDQQVPALPAESFTAAVSSGAVVIDVRPVRDFAAGHVAGAISIPLRAQFASWLGWLLQATTPYLVIRNRDQDLGDLAWQAAKIGFRLPLGELAGGMPGWNGATATTPLLKPDQVGDSHVLDVRQDSEFHAGHLPGAEHLELGALRDRAGDVDAGPVVVMCGHGERAMTGASILQRAGHRGVQVLDGGPDDWSVATGRTLK